MSVPPNVFREREEMNEYIGEIKEPDTQVVDNKLGQKIAVLRQAHHLTTRDLADRCSCDEQVIVDLENGSAPSSLAPLIKITRALGVRLGTLMDDDEALGPVYTSVEQMAEVARMKSLQTSSDAGELSYFSLAANKPSRHMDPFIITITPSGELDHKLVGHEGEEWLFCMEGEFTVEYGKEKYVIHPGESIYYDSIVPHQVRSHDGQTAKFLAVVYSPV